MMNARSLKSNPPHSLRALVLACLMATGAAAQSVLITHPTVVLPTDLSITPTQGGPAVPLVSAQIVVDGTTLEINGRHDVVGLQLINQAKVTHAVGQEYDYSGVGTDVVYGAELNLSGYLVVDAGCEIDVSGAGYGPAVGQGGGVTSGGCNFLGAYSSSGGGYGGLGGNACGQNFGRTYGDMQSPDLLGSGGGTSDNGGAYGGGSLVVHCAGTVTVDGMIRSNGLWSPAGTNMSHGGGSGGSVWIDAQGITGIGGIEADGGGGSAGTWARASGGGGGRISLTAGMSIPTSLTVHALGGAGTQYGGAGTCFYSEVGKTRLELRNNNTLLGVGSDVLGPVVVDELLIAEGAILSVPRLEQLLIQTTGDVTIMANSGIRVDERGHGVNRGFSHTWYGPCGFPGVYNGSGAGHGMSGGTSGCASGGGPVGDPAFPNMFGSGGGGNSAADPNNDYSRGGGVIQIEAEGTLVVDGTISTNGTQGWANGASDSYGGGAAGSILISAHELRGSGVIELLGGAGGSSTWANGGAGSGGRLAYYADVLGSPFPMIDNPIGSVVSGPKQVLGTVVKYAAGCAFQKDDNYLFHSSLLRVGAQAIAQAESTLPGQLATLMVGFETNAYQGIQLPLPLDFLGMSGCALYHAPSIQLPQIGGANAQYVWILQIPSDPLLVGTDVYSSVVFTDDPLLGSSGLLMSETLKMVIGS